MDNYSGWENLPKDAAKGAANPGSQQSAISSSLSQARMLLNRHQSSYTTLYEMLGNRDFHTSAAHTCKLELACELLIAQDRNRGQLDMEIHLGGQAGPLGNQNFAFANQAGLDSNAIVGTHIHFLQLDISDSAKIAHITASSSRDRRVMRYYVERLTIGDVCIFLWLARSSRVGRLPRGIPRQAQILNHGIAHFPDATMSIIYINVEDGFTFIRGLNAAGVVADTPFVDFENTDFHLDEPITLDQLELFRMKYADQMPLQSHMIDYLSILLCIQCSGTGNQIVRRGGENWRIGLNIAKLIPFVRISCCLAPPVLLCMHFLLTRSRQMIHIRSRVDHVYATA